jgi:Ca-activated chloride channel family protein
MRRFLPRICIFALCLSLIAWFNPHGGKTKEGNRLYKDNLYDDAMEKYTEALIDLPNSAYLHFNIGDAAYKKGNYVEASKSYTKAASLATDPMLESRSYYNLGNSKYRQGKLKENTSPAEAISFYREALDYYKRALDKNPEDTNAKYNHEFVERKIKELLDKQKQEQQDQTGNQQEQQQGEESQSSRKEKSDSEEKSEKQQETQAAQEQSEDQKEQQQAGKAEKSEEKKEKLTAEEARILLDSLSDEELSELQRPRRTGQFPQVL